VVRLPPNERGECGLLVTAIDTTEQVRARHRIEEASRQAVTSLAQFEAVLDTMTDAVVILDPNGKATRMNRACLELIGFDRFEDYRQFLETHDRLFEELCPDGSVMPIEQRPLSRVLRGESFTGEIVRYHRIDTDKSWIGSVSGGPVRDQSGSVFAGLLTFHDVTKLRALEESREDFLRAITHDLRTPLTAVLGGAQLLRRTADRPVLVDKTASMIEGNAWRMTRMVRELADVASLEAGRLQPNIQPVDVGSVVFAVKDRLVGMGGVDRIRVAIDEPPPLAQGDPDFLDRIITNLLTNALKYSAQSSEVVVCITFDENEVTIAVVDHGEGIAAEHLPRLFERYFRVPNVATRREGLGLGLYITRGLVRALGGRVEVTSQLGVGSTFSFALPRCT
jgi:PAS domain S-box-containing protein